MQKEFYNNKENFKDNLEKTDEEKIINIVFQAGDIALKKQTESKNSFNKKKDGSLVSKVDILVNKVLLNFLSENYPNIKVLTEEDENKNQLAALKENTFFIIDPIDGTKEYINGEKFYTVNMSLVINNSFSFSIIYAPALNLMMFANDKKTYLVKKIKNTLRKNVVNCKVLAAPKRSLDILATKRDEELAKIKLYLENQNINYNIVNISSSIKFCYVSQNIADIYIRKARIKLWDIAAGFHIANNAGCIISDINGNSIYDKILIDKNLKKISENNFFVDEFIVSSILLS
tara:strand:+ start:72 stop:938 length:867 start_codon:yes stop_codon:yes gene_type:complete